jgi:hypothetical protein
MYLGAFCVPLQYYVTFVHSFYLFFQFSNDFLLQVYAVVCLPRTWTRNKDHSSADLTLCWLLTEHRCFIDSIFNGIDSPLT